MDNNNKLGGLFIIFSSIHFPLFLCLSSALNGSQPFCANNTYASCVVSPTNIQSRPCASSNQCSRGGGSPPPTTENATSILNSTVMASPPQYDGTSILNSTAVVSAPEYAIPPDGSPIVYPADGDIHLYTSPSNKGVLLIFIIITLAPILLCWCLMRRRSTDDPRKLDVENFLLQQGSLALKRYKFSEIKKMTKFFNDKLGQGGYGTVYKGILSDKSRVAVKVLKETDSNGEEFMNEVASISRTSHVNIVNLLGFCYEKDKRALVYEFMPNMSLDKIINKENVERQLDMEKMYKIAIGVAKGLEYLHMGCNTRIVHFDIKPQNILLDEEFCPKISDFGLAKLCKKKQSILSVIGMRGTIGYIAPEVFSRNFGGVSYKCDVYSYGMTILDMIGATKIDGMDETQLSEDYFPDKIYEKVIDNAINEVDNFEEDGRERKMLLVGFWCIQTNPTDRPSISKVLEMLEGNIQSIPIPPKPFLFLPPLSEQEFQPSFYEETQNSSEG